METNIATFGLKFCTLVSVIVYSYLLTDFYHNLEVSLLKTRNCLNHICVLHNLKKYVRYKTAVTSIVNAITECLIFYFSHFSGLVDHSYVYKFTL